MEAKKAVHGETIWATSGASPWVIRRSRSSRVLVYVVGMTLTAMFGFFFSKRSISSERIACPRGVSPIQDMKVRVTFFSMR